MDTLIKPYKTAAIKKWLHEKLLLEKLNNPAGYVFLLGIGGALAYLTSLMSSDITLLILVALLWNPLVLLCFANLYAGILTMLVFGFFISLIGKYVDAPIGTTLDSLLFLMLLGLIIRLYIKKDFSFAKNRISTLVLAWIGYNLIEVINPWALSRLAWVYTVRTVALLFLVYFIAYYALDSLKKIKTVLKLMLFLTFLSALYAIKQEVFGFSPTETAWLNADEERFMLIFQWSRLRVFSFFSDPTTLGILMGYMGIFSFILATGPFKWRNRLMLLIAGIAMMVAMSLAGSRTPVVIVPACLLFYLLLTLKRSTLIATGIIMLLGTAFVMKSTSSAVIWRVQSAFKPSQDASVKVRMDNQKRIQPFIQRHPFGAGLGSTGTWGKRFSPGSMLANFAHDSLYVRLAVETGWIGLIIYMALLFTVLKTSIYYYFRVKNSTIKLLYLGLTSNLFFLSLASYPQEAITLLPTSILFYVTIAMVVRLKDFDGNFAITPKAEKAVSEKLPSTPNLHFLGK